MRVISLPMATPRPYYPTKRYAAFIWARNSDCERRVRAFGMKQSLSLKFGQQLTMTPQLQQAIRLLQLSTLDLRQEIQQAVESNPMLELVEDEDDGAAADGVESGRRIAVTPEVDEFRELAGDGDVLAEQMPEDLPVDSSWDDVFQSATRHTTGADDDFDGAERTGTEESLQDHLLWQLNLTPMSERDLAIARAIIDGIDRRRDADRDDRGDPLRVSRPSTRSKKTKSLRCSSAFSNSIPPASPPAICANAC